MRSMIRRQTNTRSSAACAAPPVRNLSSGQRDHMGVAVVDGKIHAIAGRMDSYDFNTGLNAVYDLEDRRLDLPRASADTTQRSIMRLHQRQDCRISAAKQPVRSSATNEAYDPKTDTLGAAHTDGDPAARAAWSDLRCHRRHGPRARWRPGAGRTGSRRLSRRIHLRLKRTKNGRPACQGRPFFIEETLASARRPQMKLGNARRDVEARLPLH